jgi:hypothetical protein
MICDLSCKYHTPFCDDNTAREVVEHIQSSALVVGGSRAQMEIVYPGKVLSRL